jgi:acetylglutamate kinase
LEKASVVKIGGSTFDSRDTTIEDIVSLQQAGHPLVIVHGGGSMVTDWLKRLGVETSFFRGERVTDRPALEVATAVLAGLANKEIAAAINCRGGRAVGISGLDGPVVRCRMRNRDMGYVGDVVAVEPALLETLLADGFIPVVSPMSLHSEDRPADAPPIINVNGDPLAGEIAAALGAARLVFLTDVDGVRDGSGNAVARLSAEEATSLVAEGVASGGMIPKINACLRALKVNAETRIIDGRKPHALLNEFDGREGGTTIAK